MLAHIQKFEEALHTVHDEMTKLKEGDARIKKLEDEVTGANLQKGVAEDSIGPLNARILALEAEVNGDFVVSAKLLKLPTIK
jgi:hypothetical protein